MFPKFFTTILVFSSIVAFFIYRGEAFLQEFTLFRLSLHYIVHFFCRTPRDPHEINIKRVIGLEGDVVSTLGYKNRTVRIPAGYCWVEGDNHLASDDSNRIGPVSKLHKTVENLRHILHAFFDFKKAWR